MGTSIERGLLTRVIVVILGLFFFYLLFGGSSNAPAAKQPKQPERNDAVDVAWNERSNWRRDQNEEIASRRSIYTADMFKTEALKTNGLKPVTAIMLSWKRPEGLKNVIQFLGRYPFIKEILIWNNNKKARLNVRDFELNASTTAHVEIRVFNSDENLHDLSKYTTCAMARYDYCYFQDDDWLNLYLDSMYTNFLRYPNLIHSNTMPIIHLEHRRWQFTNQGKCPSESTKAKEVQGYNAKYHLSDHPILLICFLHIAHQHNIAQPSTCTPALPGSDVALSSPESRCSASWRSSGLQVWYPYQLSNPLTPLEQKEGWSDGVDQWTIVYQNIYDAGSKLYKALAANSGITAKDYFTRDEEDPLPEQRDTRAPCLDDKCLFLTNIDPFPHPSAVVFNNVNVTHINEQEALFNELDFPSNDFWTKHAYHYAVDRDETTCWNSYKAPRVGDYFGLHMVTPIKSKRFTIVSSKDISSLESAFSISISINGDHWVTCKHRTLADDGFSADPHRLTIGFSCPISEPVRFVRADFQRDFNQPFEVCSVGLQGFAV
ncbi:hypothetical protein BC937DRAFT_89031 [Endogone sp. FLAS-F59071]|nr:hypothetical protein BC937DRAFT_89031 [Endogone sp. FLAS-F59071]|eukprot:RUS18215.1 hypothetical protein BC937DRAFT_89031 [Endogone sp. FLAS-F59071]